MKKIMVFCIPAHGHHNPTLPVVVELVRRGHDVRYYSFEEFREKIQSTGAVFFACDVFLPELTETEMDSLKKVSTTEMTIADLRTAAKMDGFLKEQVAEFQPDVIFTDSVCFWGKMTARKYKIPMVVSNSTFAFNRFSAQYMKNSFSEVWDLMRGTKRVNAELKKLEQYGYQEKSIMPLVQNDNYTDTVVYATREYQPCSETFSKHYAFVGPSVFSDEKPHKENAQPIVYVSLGTVINDRPDFYSKCIEALAGENVELIISCGNIMDPKHLGPLPENVKVFQTVNQLAVLAKANVFLTHCGMNSVSESLYMATPMVLFPQTNEQRAVARRASELNAGLLLDSDNVEQIRKAVQAVLEDRKYADGAASCSRNFRQASGPSGAAEFIESAPHCMPEEDKRFARNEILAGILQLLFWIAAIILIIWLPQVADFISWWALAIFFNILFIPFKSLSLRLFI